jgi:beta-glucosidase
LLERILDPIILGDYPSEMRKILGSDLPRFTSEERNLLMRTKVDFIGINHYSTVYVKDCILSQCVLNSFEGNGLLATTGEKDGNLIGNPVNKKKSVC